VVVSLVGRFGCSLAGTRARRRGHGGATPSKERGVFLGARGHKVKEEQGRPHGRAAGLRRGRCRQVTRAAAPCRARLEAEQRRGAKRERKERGRGRVEKEKGRSEGERSLGGFVQINLV
jgi:hypothetical protein